jgi:hypothetical protein
MGAQTQIELAVLKSLSKPKAGPGGLGSILLSRAGHLSPSSCVGALKKSNFAGRALRWDLPKGKSPQLSHRLVLRVATGMSQTQLGDWS